LVLSAPPAARSQVSVPTTSWCHSRAPDSATGAYSSTAPSGDPTPADPAPTYGHGHDPPLGFHTLSIPPHRQLSPRTATTRRPPTGGHPPRTRASQQERSRRRYLESPARASPSAEVAIRRMAGPLPASWDSRISLGNSPRPTLQRVEPLSVRSSALVPDNRLVKPLLWSA